ncbi:hypothetical protein pEaSNUABM56_00004 [Erwinia phage pEa_SNUABM_56]|uniref:Uncharacterized protein n=1 Tax=Erwinia phage pEp_SNUABM_01 TaxID=2601643 RepID=A0A5J6DB07_9CAUD|nr:hypothetical protein HWC63_gp124 [Erwinia phage pEp_SNUABM_01]QEQ95054.1 hypothetical protein pEpSNUABM01_228 [Erwinia phage pEp_SNUABM_01]UYL84982.1 hypothetical protein pEaSNUABM55_00209 [Erwinia phage pEa_SNUABM_55]UYL85049.1 hypothetical protein pEaSNUABM56_00004 [Erwinia phage pEa_SNUABM_56]
MNEYKIAKWLLIGSVAIVLAIIGLVVTAAVLWG